MDSEERDLYLIRLLDIGGIMLMTKREACIYPNGMSGIVHSEVVEHGRNVTELLEKLRSRDISRTWYVVIDWLDSDGSYRHTDMEPELMPLCRIPERGLRIRMNKIGDGYRVAYPISLWQRVSLHEMRRVHGFEERAMQAVGEFLRAQEKEDER